MSSNTPLPRERKPLRPGSKEDKVILSIEENWNTDDSGDDGSEEQATADGVKTSKSKPLCSPCQWLLIVCLALMGFVYTVYNSSNLNREALSTTACPPHLIPPRPETCSVVLTQRSNLLEGITIPQEVLACATRRLGRGKHSLMAQMLDLNFAARELRIRAAASKMPLAPTLDRELGALVDAARHLVHLVARYGARVGSTVDHLKALDRYSVHALEKAAQPGDQAVKAIKATLYDSRTMVQKLAYEPTGLPEKLDGMQDLVRGLRKTTLEALNSVPRHDLRRELKVLLNPAKDKAYRFRRPNRVMLRELLCLCDAVSAVVENTRAALIRADHKPGFLDGLIDPAQLFRDYPLDVVVTTVWGSLQKLEASQKKPADGN